MERRTLSRTGIVLVSGLFPVRGSRSSPTIHAAPDQKSGLRSYGSEVLASQRGGSAHSAKDIAEAYPIPPQLLAKIFQTLAKAGLLVFLMRDQWRLCALAARRPEITAFEVIRGERWALFIYELALRFSWSCDLTSTCTNQRNRCGKVNDSIKDLLKRHPHRRPGRSRWGAGWNGAGGRWLVSICKCSDRR